MESRDKAALAIFVLYLAAFCSAMAAIWPELVRHLNLANWISLVLAHLAVMGSMLGLYRKASRRIVVQAIEVLIAAGLVVMVSALDLSLIVKIGRC